MRKFLTGIEKHAGAIVIVLLHTLAWSLYTTFFALNFSNTTMSGWHKFWYLIGIIVFDVAIFYYFYFRAIPSLLQHKRAWLFVLHILVVCAIYPFAKFGIERLFEWYFAEKSTQIADLAEQNFWTGYLIRALSALFVIAMAGIGKFTFDWFKLIQIRKELENQNLQSELAFLKSQINPHFLFNTLNNIHTLAYKKSDLAPASIRKLSDLMRYMIYESNVEFVPLEHELEHLRSFIDLQQLRFKVENIVEFSVEGNSSEAQIAPLLLLPFVENAFKHSSSVGKSSIRIAIHVSAKQIHFSVVNRHKKGVFVQKDEVGGIGLDNIRRRLDLIYPDRYTLVIVPSSNEYHVLLKLTM